MMGKEFKVFISYSWTSPEHEKWVYDLAVRLMENGIEVKFDKWDLQPGQDKYAFMESIVQDETINRVLIICDEGYKSKADNREGGVGTESQIITPEIYGKTNQRKFIPIIAQRGMAFDDYLPVFLKSRIVIDMSSDDVYESGYEKLLRLIAERPEFRKPAKGQLPNYLFEDEKDNIKTKHLVKQLRHVLINKPEKAEFFVEEFIEEFKNILDSYKIEHDEFKAPYDEQIYNKVNDMLILRNDYIEFLKLVVKSRSTFNIDIVTHLFEEIYSFTEFQGNGTYYPLQFDHFKFFIHELFLYTVVIFMENSMFESLNFLLSTRFFVRSRESINSGVDFSRFRFYLESLDVHRKQRLNLKKISITADMLVQRSIFNNKNYKEKLINVDLLLYYFSSIKYDENNCSRMWFPTTYIYLEYGKSIDFLVRLSSKKHFDRVKQLFNVQNEEEMKKCIQNFPNPYSSGYNNSFEGIPHIKNFINPESICKFM